VARNTIIIWGALSSQMRGDDPFARIEKALEAQRRYFEVLAGDIRQAIAEGRPLAETVKTAGRSEAPNWTLFDEYNERNATAAYAELEWE
jgi:hypothetical protein